MKAKGRDADELRDADNSIRCIFFEHKNIPFGKNAPLSRVKEPNSLVTIQIYNRIVFSSPLLL